MPEPITLLDLDAAGLDLTQPAPLEFIEFLAENSVNGYVTLWSTVLDEDGFRVIWPWLNAADEARYPQYRLKIQFVEPPTAVKPAGAHVTEITYSGGTPAWVPSDAKIHIDFLGGTPQGRAWVDGTGEVAVDTLLGYDPNADASFGSLAIDPFSYTPEGYDASGKLAFLGDALALVLAGATFVVKMMHDSSTEAITSDCRIGLASLDGADAVEIVITSTTNSLASWGGDLSSTTANTFTNGVALAVNIVAATVTISRLEMALNGAAPLAGVLADADRPASNPFICAVVQNPNYNSVSSITFYDPLPTTAGLAALSAIS